MGVMDARNGRGRGLLPREGREVSSMKTVFLRVLEADDKAAALLAAIREPESGARGRQRFEVDRELRARAALAVRLLG